MSCLDLEERWDGLSASVHDEWTPELEGATDRLLL